MPLWRCQQKAFLCFLRQGRRKSATRRSPSVVESIRFCRLPKRRNETAIGLKRFSALSLFNWLSNTDRRLPLAYLEDVHAPTEAEQPGRGDLDVVFECLASDLVQLHEAKKEKKKKEKKKGKRTLPSTLNAWRIAKFDANEPKRSATVKQEDNLPDDP